MARALAYQARGPGFDSRSGHNNGVAGMRKVKLGSFRFSSLTAGLLSQWLERSLTKQDVPGSIAGRVTTMGIKHVP